MRTTKSIQVIASVLLVAVVLVAWLHLRSRTRAATIELLSIVREDEKAASEIVRREQELAAMHSETASLQHKLTTTDAPGSAAAPVTPVPPRATLEIPSLLAEHPDWRPSYEASAKGEILIRYAPLIAAQGMSANQSEAFAAELARHNERQAEARITAREQGWHVDDPRVRALQLEEEERHARELGRLLGDDGYRQLEAFNRTLGIRDLVGKLAQQLYYTDTPLTRTAAEQATQTFARHALNAKGQVDRAALKWDAALAEARGFLSPEQITTVQRVREQEQFQREINRIVARAAKRSSSAQ